LRRPIGVLIETSGAGRFRSFRLCADSNQWLRRQPLMKVLRASPVRCLLLASVLQLAMRCCGVTAAVAVWAAIAGVAAGAAVVTGAPWGGEAAALCLLEGIFLQAFVLGGAVSHALLLRGPGGRRRGVGGEGKGSGQQQASEQGGAVHGVAPSRVVAWSIRLRGSNYSSIGDETFLIVPARGTAIRGGPAS